MSAELSGKVSIITGASSGLGEATAILFARKGAKITLCGRDQERLQAVFELCTQVSGGHQDRFIIAQGDICDPKVRDETLAKTVQQFGRLDILVANAGMCLPTDSHGDATEETFDNIFNLNVKSIFFLTQKAVPHLQKTKGTIITMSSVASVVTTSFMLYAMSKAALDHMTRCLSIELGPKGIRVNSVNPSYIESRLRRNHSADYEGFDRLVIASENHKQPMGECGKPDDVAQAVLFLASDAAKFITGENLFIDGGRRYIGPMDKSVSL